MTKMRYNYVFGNNSDPQNCLQTCQIEIHVVIRNNIEKYAVLWSQPLRRVR